MAEGLLKSVLSDAGKKDYVISSAGLGAVVGHHPDANARELMLKKNINIANYRARQLDTEMIRKADLILVMESVHKSAIEDFEPSAKGKIFRLGHWGDFDISDPYHQSLSAFEHSLQLIEQGISDWLLKL
jgi:protein-tyrosine phosphatase